MIFTEFFSWESWLIDSLIKVTIVLSIAMAADFWLSRRRNFVLVSGLWNMVIVGVLVLPLASVVIPSQPGWISLPLIGNERFVASKRANGRKIPTSTALSARTSQFSMRDDSSLSDEGQQAPGQPTRTLFNPIESRGNLAARFG